MLMRHREIGPVSTQLVGGQAYSSNSFIYPVYEAVTLSEEEAAPIDALQRHEVMEDLPNPPPPCGFKPCVHNTVRGDWMSERFHQMLYRSGYDGDGTYGLKRYTNQAINASHPNLVPYINELMLSDGLTHSDRWALSSAWERAKPRLEPNLDLLVFLAEIKDLPDLAKSLYKKLSVLTDDVADIAGKALKYADGLKILARHEDVGAGGMLKIVMDESSHALSSQWIEYNFAIAPTVSELMGMLTAVFTYGKKLDDLIAGAGKPQKTHVSFAYTEEPGIDWITEDPCTECEDHRGKNPVCAFAASRGHSLDEDANVPGSWAYRTTPGGKEIRIGLTVFYRYSLPPWVNEISGKINALAGVLGVNPGLGTIWELIPFSFVLDWVWPIGQILDRARVDAIPVKTEILDVCWTKKTQQAALIHATFGACPYGREIQPVFQGKLETFQRIVGTEPFTWIPAFNWPNWMQISLGAALASILKKR